MPHDVFISYASEDKNVADAACHHLERAGVRCWIAPRDVRPGAAWPSEIAAAIDSCRILVLILSRSCNESQQTLREVTIAVDAGKHIFPVRIHDVTPSASLRYLLSVPHWMDAMNPPLEAHLSRLADSVRAALGAPGEPAPPAPVPPPARPRSRAALGWVLGLAAAAGLAAAGIILVPQWLRPARGPVSTTLPDTNTQGQEPPVKPAPPRADPPAEDAPSPDAEFVRAQWHAWFGSLVAEREVIRSEFGDDPVIAALADTLGADAAHRESPEDLAKRPAPERDARARAQRAYIESVAAIFEDRWEPRDRLASLAILAQQEKWSALATRADEIAGALREARGGGTPIGSMKLWLERVRDEQRTLDELQKVVSRCQSDAKQIGPLGPGISEALLARMSTTLDLVAFTGKADATLTLARSHAGLVSRLWEAARNDMPHVDTKSWLDNPHVRKFSSGEPIEHSDFEALLADARSPEYVLETKLSREQVLGRFAAVKPGLADAPPPETPLPAETMTRLLSAQARLRALLGERPALDDRAPWTQAAAARFSAAADAWIAGALAQQRLIEESLAGAEKAAPQSPPESPAQSPTKTAEPGAPLPAPEKPPAPADTSLLARLAGKTLLSVWVYDERQHRDYWTMQVGEVRNGTASVGISGRTTDSLTATAAGDRVRLSVPPYPRSRDKAWTGDLDFSGVNPADEPIVLSGLAPPGVSKSAAPKGAWYIVEIPPRVTMLSTLPGVRANRGSDELLAGGRVPIDPVAANTPLKAGIAMLARDAALRLRGEFLRFDSDTRDRAEATIKVAADGRTLWSSPIGAAKSVPIDLEVPRGTQQLELSIDRLPKPAVWNALRLEAIPAPR